MNYLIAYSVFVALVAAFVVALLKKWGVAEYMQVHGDRFSFLRAFDTFLFLLHSLVLSFSR